MRKFLLWLLAFIITAASAVYQRMTGPTYPIRGKIVLDETEIRYKLPRSAETTVDCKISVEVANPDVTGRLRYKRHKTDDPWTEVAMTRERGQLVGYLPWQPMAGKLAYQVILAGRGQEVSLSSENAVIIRFRRKVPIAVLVGHVLVIFLAMLFSTRAGLAALDRKSNPRKLVIWTAVLLFVGGFILGPLMQKFAFGAWWTGFPVGKDLTDSKTLVAMLVWLAAVFAGRGGKPARGWVLAASLLTIVIFLIPHSVLGSELKYTDLKG